MFIILVRHIKTYICGGRNLNSFATAFHVRGLFYFRVASFQLAVYSLCSLVAFDVEIELGLQRCPACRFESLQDQEKNRSSKTHITPFHKSSLTSTSIAWAIGQIYSGPARAVSFRCCLQMTEKSTSQLPHSKLNMDSKNGLSPHAIRKFTVLAQGQLTLTLSSLQTLVRRRC